MIIVHALVAKKAFFRCNTSSVLKRIGGHLHEERVGRVYPHFPSFASKIACLLMVIDSNDSREYVYKFLRTIGMY